MPHASITTIYRVLAVAGVAAPYVDFAIDHRRVPLAAVGFSLVALVAILAFLEKRKALLPYMEGEGRRKGARTALFIFCGSLVVHSVVLSYF